MISNLATHELVKIGKQESESWESNSSVILAGSLEVLVATLHDMTILRLTAPDRNFLIIVLISLPYLAVNDLDSVEEWKS